MLVFWNLAGVPLSYCHCTLYLINHDPAEYRWPRWALVLFFSSYLFVYWVWDTCNSQKNIFRQRERGDTVDRKTFPQLPWKEVKNPRVIKTDTGDSLLCDGWCTFANRCFQILILRRRACPEGALHVRCVLCSDVGPHHGLLQPVPVVLPLLLRLYDRPPRPARHHPLSEEIRPGLGGVHSPGALALHSCEFYGRPQLPLTLDSTSFKRRNSILFSSCISGPLPLRRGHWYLATLIPIK